MENALNWYLGIVIPPSFLSYLCVSVIVALVSVVLLCVYETRKMKNKRPQPRGLPEGRKENICLISLLLAILWPIIVTAAPVGLALALGLWLIVSILSVIINFVLKVVK